jgi:hypothetical protein
MLHRWIIRSFFIGLCVVCVGIWTGSYFQAVNVEYTGLERDRWYSVECGSLIFCNYGFPSAVLHWNDSVASDTWIWSHRRARSEFMHNPYFTAEYRFAGFSYSCDPGVFRSSFQMSIPLYFPTLLGAFLLWFVWRKTGVRSAGGAFPAETLPHGEPCVATARLGLEDGREKGWALR